MENENTGLGHFVLMLDKDKSDFVMDVFTQLNNPLADFSVMSLFNTDIQSKSDCFKFAVSVLSSIESYSDNDEVGEIYLGFRCEEVPQGILFSNADEFHGENAAKFVKELLCYFNDEQSVSFQVAYKQISTSCGGIHLVNYDCLAFYVDKNIVDYLSLSEWLDRKADESIGNRDISSSPKMVELSDPLPFLISSTLFF